MTPRERVFALEQFGVKLGLDNITTLCSALGHPERAGTVIHIAGTNGKGSVTAMVERGLRAAGHRTGRYTSPHLAHIEERIAVDGTAISPAFFDAVAAEVLAAVDRLLATGALTHSPTFFEVTTAMAFEAFRRSGVTTAVVEVGLGGRWDATNIVSPVITAVTSLSMDHREHLGDTIQQIAFEKAGIIKRGVPVVTAPLAPEAAAVIAKVAAGLDAPVVRAEVPSQGEPLRLGLAGAHQHENAAVAVQVLRLAAGLAPPVTRTHVVTALTAAEWPARLEWLRLPGQGDVLLDAAHNPAGAHALAHYLRTEPGELPLVLGVMGDKDIDAMVDALAPAVTRIVVTQADHPRALPAAALATRVRSRVPGMTVAIGPSPLLALQQMLREHTQAVVAGSIFLVGPLRAHLLENGAKAVRYSSKAGPFLLD